MEPRIDALGAKYADDSRVKIAKLDVDANSELAQEQQIMSLPTFRVYVGGEMVGQELGLISPPVLESLLLKGLTKVGPAKA
jgi:thioredoxin-like negative regulator of GroEL